MTVKELLLSKREEVLAIAERHGAKNVRVFGSAAHGIETDESTIDLLVDVRGNQTSFAPAGMVSDLETLLHRKVVVITPDALHPLIHTAIMKEAVQL
jgi:predicted nucleotidyltransferase